MKNVILATFLATASIATSSVALANPFDSFIGEYKVSSAPQITKQNTTFCNRFDFREIIGLKVEADTKGYAQSHILYILNPHGWSGHPTMDYDYTNEYKTGGSYAKTSGSSTSASNEWGTWGVNPKTKESLTVTIEKSGKDFNFSMREDLIENSNLTASCSYQVKLVKK